MIPVTEQQIPRREDPSRVSAERQLLLGYPCIRGEREKVRTTLQGMRPAERSLTYEWATLSANPLGIIDHAHSITQGYHERDPNREDRLGLESTWKELEGIRRWFQLLQSRRPSVVLDQHVPEDSVGEPIEHLYWMVLDDRRGSIDFESLDTTVRDCQLHVKYNDKDFSPIPTDDRSWRNFRKPHFWYSHRDYELEEGEPTTLSSFMGPPPWPGIEE